MQNPYRTAVPAYKILAYDARIDTIGEVVRGEATQTPLDLTEFATNIQWNPSELSFNVADPDGRFNPDNGEWRGYLRHGSIIRLLEGDERIPEADWIYTFTGIIQGQIGWAKSRRNTQRVGQVKVFNRGATNRLLKNH